MNSSEYYIGLMSGTSLDGIDVALVAFERCSKSGDVVTSPNTKSLTTSCSLIASIDYPLPIAIVDTLAAVSAAENVELHRLCQLEIELAHLFANAVTLLLQQQNIDPSAITAIGCHGITIRHCPNAPLGFSKQIGDASTLAALTGIDVIADFRMADVAEGGQGAPLVPPFHEAVFGGLQDTAVLNLGGIANVTYLNAQQQLVGFDTGPANTLMDAWCREHINQSYDRNGQWAASGQVNQALLNRLLDDGYFSLTAPKSTGKEQFNLNWLRQHLKQLAFEVDTISAADIQATLLQLTVKSIQQVVHSLPSVKQVLVCGGGVHNKALMTQLKLALPSLKVESTLNQGVCPDAMEAMAFAWLAYCRVHNVTSNSPSVTGAKKSKILGAWHKC